MCTGVTFLYPDLKLSFLNFCPPPLLLPDAEFERVKKMLRGKKLLKNILWQKHLWRYLFVNKFLMAKIMIKIYLVRTFLKEKFGQKVFG